MIEGTKKQQTYKLIIGSIDVNAARYVLVLPMAVNTASIFLMLPVLRLDLGWNRILNVIWLVLDLLFELVTEIIDYRIFEVEVDVDEDLSKSSKGRSMISTSGEALISSGFMMKFVQEHVCFVIIKQRKIVGNYRFDEIKETSNETKGSKSPLKNSTRCRRNMKILEDLIKKIKVVIHEYFWALEVVATAQCWSWPGLTSVIGYWSYRIYLASVVLFISVPGVSSYRIYANYGCVSFSMLTILDLDLYLDILDFNLDIMIFSLEIILDTS
ncbi:hypothetical protein Tco_1377898 [Tanacetum coccineum]